MFSWGWVGFGVRGSQIGIVKFATNAAIKTMTKRILVFTMFILLSNSW